MKDGLRPDCQDAKLHAMYHTYMLHKKPEDFAELHRELGVRKRIDDRFWKLKTELSLTSSDLSYHKGKPECYKGIVQMYM